MYPLIGDVDYGEDVHGRGWGLCGKSLPFSKACCEPQAALKIKSIHKNLNKKTGVLQVTGNSASRQFFNSSHKISYSVSL